MAHLVAQSTMFLCVLLMVSCPLSTAEEGNNVGQKLTDNFQRLKPSLNEQMEKYGETRNLVLSKSEPELISEEEMEALNSVQDPKVKQYVLAIAEMTRLLEALDKQATLVQKLGSDLDQANGAAGIPTGLFWLVVLSALYLLQAARLRA